MTTTTTESAPPPAALADPLATAAALGPRLAAAAAEHDRHGDFVGDAYDLLHESGLLRLAVPTELGGLGASPAEVAAVQRELGRHCGSTALASAMHQHVTTFTAWRYRRGLPGAEATLRRVADEGIVLVSTGGADLTRPQGGGRAVDGGYRVSGRKAFCSQAPVGTVLSTMFTIEDDDGALRVINAGVPVASPGVRVLEDWDASGMRGTGSNTIELEDVFIPAERVLAERPWGVLDPPLQVILSIAIPIVTAAYLGVVDGIVDATLDSLATSARTERREDPLVQRAVGHLATRVRIAEWALTGALATVGDDPQPSMDTVAAVMAAKAEVIAAGDAAAEVATEVVGGSTYRRGSAIERGIRDLRAARFHPLTADRALLHAGRIALGEPADVV